MKPTPNLNSVVGQRIFDSRQMVRDTDIKRLWKRIPQVPRMAGIGNGGPGNPFFEERCVTTTAFKVFEAGGAVITGGEGNEDYDGIIDAWTGPGLGTTGDGPVSVTVPIPPAFHNYTTQIAILLCPWDGDGVLIAPELTPILDLMRDGIPVVLNSFVFRGPLISTDPIIPVSGFYFQFYGTSLVKDFQVVGGQYFRPVRTEIGGGPGVNDIDTDLNMLDLQQYNELTMGDVLGTKVGSMLGGEFGMLLGLRVNGVTDVPSPITFTIDFSRLSLEICYGVPVGS